MKRKTLIHVMAATMILGSASAGVPVCAGETQVTEQQSAETEAPETQSAGTETKAPETQAAETETKAPETQAAELETKAPETQPAETETKAPETQPAETETKAPETQAVETETKAPETQAVETETKAPETQAVETETKAPETQPAETETKAPETQPAEAETKAPDKEQTEQQTDEKETPEADPEGQSEEQESQKPAKTETESETEEEETEKPETDREPETEAVFTSGYAYVKKAAAVYRDRRAAAGAELGHFTEKAAVYAKERFADGDGNDDNDWLRVAFVVKDGEKLSVEEGYVQAAQLQPVSEAETASLTAQMRQNPEHVCYQNREDLPLTPAAFEKRETEGGLPELTMTEEAGAEESGTEAATETGEAATEPGTEAGEAAEEPDTEVLSETDEAAEPVTEGADETAPDVVPVQYMITADWENENLGLGDLVTLTAVCDAGAPVLWQSSGDGAEWTTIAESRHYTYVLTEENYRQLIRAVSADEM